MSRSQRSDSDPIEVFTWSNRRRIVFCILFAVVVSGILIGINIVDGPIYLPYMIQGEIIESTAYQTHTEITVFTTLAEPRHHIRLRDEQRLPPARQRIEIMLMCQQWPAPYGFIERPICTLQRWRNI